MIKKSSTSAKSAINSLNSREAELQDEMERLKSFISVGAEQKHLEQINTIPPPDDLDQRARELSHIESLLTNKELRNTKKAQSKDLLLLILLVIAIVSLGSWVYRVYSEHYGF